MRWHEIPRPTGAVLLLAASLLQACAPPRAPGTAELRGDVFIVTANGQSVKLPLINVFIYNESELKPLIAEIRRSAEQELLVREALFLDVLQHEQDELRRSEDATLKAEHAREAAARQAGRAKVQWEAAAALGKLAMEAAASHQAASEHAREALDQLDAVRSPNFIFEHLPPSTISARTDADGRFLVNVPAEGRIAIAASAPAVAGELDLPYFWLIWMQIDGRSKRIFLSNDNVLSARPQEAVVDLQAWPDDSAVSSTGRAAALVDHR